MEMQHILVQDWIEEGALKSFAKVFYEEGQSFVAGYLAVSFSDHEMSTAKRRYSI